MTKKEQIKWRLGKLPTPDEVRELVKDKIITQDEAREILFSKETQEDRDENSLKAEIKFLRELVEKLSQSRDRIIEVVKEYKPTYIRYDWFSPYWNWTNYPYCYTTTTVGDSITVSGNSLIDASSSSTVALNNSSFSDIKTF